MEITRDFLQEEIAKMAKQRDHAHDVAVASQAAIDVMQALMARIEAPAEKDLTFSDLGLPDPVPIQNQKE